MSATEQSFRGAAFGGFNRQDVLRYIETASKEHNGRLAALKTQMEAEHATCISLEQRCESAELRETESAARAQRAEEHLAKVNAQHNAAQAELEEKRVRLAAAERELADLRDQVGQMAPAATAYEGLKDRAATIELEAHQRAQSIVETAEKTAETTRKQLCAWVEKVRSSYGRLCADVSATLSHADGELERAQHSLAGVSDEFSDYDAALKEIADAFQAGVTPKPIVRDDEQ
ncbi:MAG: hypothetical protein RSC08_03230 [Oscillospiraceae bacterium]